MGQLNSRVLVRDAPSRLSRCMPPYYQLLKRLSVGGGGRLRKETRFSTKHQVAMSETMAEKKTQPETAEYQPQYVEGQTPNEWKETRAGHAASMQQFKTPKERKSGCS